MAKRFSVEATFEGKDKVSRPVMRMESRFRRATSTMSRGLVKVTKGLTKVSKNVARVGLGVSKWAAAAAGGGFALVTMLNKSAVESELLTKSVLQNTETMEALGAAVRPIGLEFDNIIDLAEEMNNKLGESAGVEEMTAVSEALTILGLEFENIRRLAPDKQFETIVDSLLKLEDAQKAAAAGDILFGGEANKVIGILRLQARSVDELIDKHKELTFRTAASKKGAKDFTFALNETITLVASLAKEIAGLLGAALTPVIKEFSKWIKLKQDLIRTKAVEFIDKLGPRLLTAADGASKVADAVMSIAGAINSVSGFFEGVGNFFRVIGEGRANTAGGGFVSQVNTDNPAVVSPDLITSREIRETRERQQAEVVITDKTGKAEIVSGFEGLKLQRSGAL